MKKEQNLIWFSNERKPNIINQGKIIITDKNGFSKLIDELNDVSTYVYSGKENCAGKIMYPTKYTNDGIIINKKDPQTEYYYQSYSSYFYTNPHAKVKLLLTSNFKSNQSLLELFATIASGDNKEKQLEAFQKAKILIAKLETSSLDNETISEIIKQMWPNFGCYATDGLSCTDIEIVQSYNIDDINSIIEISKKAGVAVESKVNEIFTNKELAQTNGKVLALAKKAHKVSE